MHFEEDAFLTELVQLWITIQQTGADKLVKYAEDEWREDGEEDVVKGEGPRLKDGLAGEGVLEGVLGGVSCEAYVTRFTVDSPRTAS